MRFVLTHSGVFALVTAEGEEGEEEGVELG